MAQATPRIGLGGLAGPRRALLRATIGGGRGDGRRRRPTRSIAAPSTPSRCSTAIAVSGSATAVPHKTIADAASDEAITLAFCRSHRRRRLLASRGRDRVGDASRRHLAATRVRLAQGSLLSLPAGEASLFVPAVTELRPDSRLRFSLLQTTELRASPVTASLLRLSDVTVFV